MALNILWMTEHPALLISPLEAMTFGAMVLLLEEGMLKKRYWWGVI